MLYIFKQSIIAAQSTDIDTVSGATFSSEGIINAVVAALENARQ
ncbi:MAG: FMN-binding protein [Lachnospiraceae bacterium]|nr:FMN-binding protein [Lachnospiraceae bacterium]